MKAYFYHFFAHILKANIEGYKCERLSLEYERFFLLPWSLKPIKASISKVFGIIS